MIQDPDQNKKGTWRQAITSIVIPVLIVLAFRWLFFEPFVIPSGSMIPNLLIHDHILANKFSYGLRIPFTKKWLWAWSDPQRGDIVVFRYPENPDVFYVKRLIGLPGDQVRVEKGVIYINDQPLNISPTSIQNEESGFDYFIEEGHVVRYQYKDLANFSSIQVPEDQYFMMGDNRDQSSDSRVWGFVPHSHLIGKVSWIWLSCDEMLTSAPFLCDPQTIRWSRILHEVK